MSSIVAVAGTSHSPVLAMQPDVMWKQRAQDDSQNDELYASDGRVRAFDELVKEAAGRFDHEITPAVWREKYDRAQRAMRRLSDDLKALAPDVLLIIGDDQDELFTRRNQPAIAVYYGDLLATHQPIDYGSELLTQVQRELGMDGQVYPAHPEVGLHLIRHLVDTGFDIASSSETETESGFGHAFAFVVGRLLAGYEVPVVPVLINTYFPPNQPTPDRCYELGRAIKEAIDALPGDLRIAVVASGGLSHFVVDDELDRVIISAMENKHAATLRNIDPIKLNSGTSEARNWIAAAGAGEHLQTQWTEYIPAWRSEAGTGIGLAFGFWA